MIGRLAYRFRAKFGHGIRVAYWRDVVRPRILQTAPIDQTTDESCAIHVMTSSNDWLNLVWALKSFYVNSGRRYSLTIFGDNSLSPRELETLQRHFPAARIISRAQADADVLPTLAGYPRSLKFRQENHLSPKVFDFAHYLRADRMFLLDSDVLFFAEPAELLRRIEDPAYSKNTVNGDLASAYTVRPDLVHERTGVELIERFNSGLGLIHKSSMRLDWIEEFLGLPGILGHFWQIEQTLYALCSSRFGVELLPPAYDVRLGLGIDGRPCRHYIGQIRHLLYGEGIARLSRQGIFAAIDADRRL